MEKRDSGIGFAGRNGKRFRAQILDKKILGKVLVADISKLLRVHPGVRV